MQRSSLLLGGATEAKGVLPHLRRLERAPFRFRPVFGLDELPEEPGILVLRGARQFGKSTWLEGQVARTVERHGPGTALLLNGDELRDQQHLVEVAEELLPLYRADAPVRRLFIDEITAIDDWERGLKRLADAGELERVLVVTTGSRATDLRRGAERLPGRRGRLDRTTYLFTPVGFAEFERQCGDALGEDTVWAYLISGGSPLALGELGAHGRLPEYVVEVTRDWILGEVARTGRSRASLMSVMDALLRRGGTPIGQARLAREAGLANNTVAAGYVELLADLNVLGLSHAWDPDRQVRVTRKPAKFPFINLLAATSWHPERLRSAQEFRALSPEDQGPWIEWLVAQELWRRAAIRGDPLPEYLPFWQSKEHELDFVISRERYLEVKRGARGAVPFRWFPRVFPGATLEVVGAEPFATESIVGVALADFLRRRHS